MNHKTTETAAQHGQLECSSYPASGIARITHLWCVICGCCCNITVQSVTWLRKGQLNMDDWHVQAIPLAG